MTADLSNAAQDREALVAATLERAADACKELADQVSDAALTGLPEQARLRESMEAAFTKARYCIRSLATPAQTDALAAVRREARADLVALARDVYAAGYGIQRIDKPAGGIVGPCVVAAYDTHYNAAEGLKSAQAALRKARVILAAEKEAGHD